MRLHPRTLLMSAAFLTLSVNNASAARWTWIADTISGGPSEVRRAYGYMKDDYVSGDFNGDGKADLAVVRNDGTNWQWLADYNADGSTDLNVTFGSKNGRVFPGDYNGDNKTDLAVIVKDGNQWQWRLDQNRDGNADNITNYGSATDIPIAGDFNGDGKQDFAVVRKISSGKWQWIIDTNRDGSPDIRKNYGTADLDTDDGDSSDIIQPADYNGDGKTDYGVRRRSGDNWRWIADYNGDGTSDLDVNYGLTSDYAFPADYNGDGKADLAITRQVGHQWQWGIDTNRDGGTNTTRKYGEITDHPYPADYNGDGKTDLAVIRPEKTKNRYRLPFAGATQVFVSRDSYSHTAGGAPDRENFDLVGMPQGVAHGVAAAADGVIAAIEDSFNEDCPSGTPADQDCNDNNNYVWIKHDHGEWSKYTHIAENTVTQLGLSVGDPVTAGTLIGIESDVGAASGVHVHFEVGIPDDPANAITSGGFLRGVALAPRFCGVPGEVLARGVTYTATDCPEISTTLNNRPSEITIGVNPNRDN